MDTRLCPKCKKTIKEGNVYCEHCGYDIPMVPAFDARFESEMDKTISRMLEGINLEEMSEEDFEQLSSTLDLETTNDLRRRYDLARTKELKNRQAEDEDKKNREEIRDAMRTWLIPAVLILFAIVSIFVYESIRGAKTPESLIARGRAEAEAGEHEAAVEHFEQALEADPASDEAARLLALEYYELGEGARAQDMLLARIAAAPTIELYETLIGIYEKDENYQAIGNLLSASGDEQLKRVYMIYASEPPVFDKEDGSYLGDTFVSLSSQMPGRIYYTTDGSEPDTESTLYEGAIELENGKNVIRAIFVNELGVRSASVSGIFEVDKGLPDDPVVSPGPGNYLRAGYVEASAEEDHAVYYTMDGTMPDENSGLYEHPLLMPLGDSTFRFVAIDKDGRRSNITSVSYTLSLKAVCLEHEAISYVMTSLMATGVLTDLSGRGADGGSYDYNCIGMLTEGSFSYYVIEESYFDGSDDTGAPTGAYFTVETTQGILGRAQRDEKGYFRLRGF